MNMKLENKEKSSEVDHKKNDENLQEYSNKKNSFLSDDFYKCIDSEGTTSIYVLGYN